MSAPPLPLENRWDLVEQSAAFGVWDLDIPAQQVHYSPQWKMQMGYPAEDGPDSTTTWRKRVHPDDLGGMLTVLSAHLEGRSQAYEHEFRLLAGDGRYRWMFSRGRVVARDAAGLPLRAVGTLTDLTDRREAEQMRLARDKAEAERRAQADFLARMSHELRTPLNAVLGFAQLLSPRLGDSDLATQRSYLDHIEQAGWHLLRLVEEMLVQAQTQAEARQDAKAGEGTTALAPLALRPLVEDLLLDMAPVAERQGVRLLIADLPPQARVRSDATLLRQALASLLRHALQHNRRGGLATVQASLAGSAWMLAVCDTGPGLPPDGTALGHGLVLARSLVLAVGGQFDVHSTEGVGSIFNLTLPAA